MSAAGPFLTNARVLQLQHAFQLALSMVLLYWLALWLNWDMPKYGGLAIALISLDTTGASLQKGLMRIVGTTVGLAVGMLGLALFAQDSWLTLIYHASYLVVIGYYMQGSRYPYAWFVAGFIASLVWSTTYGKVDNAFHYAVFRYLETTAGIVIYTLVCAVFWPRQAGDKLNGQGRAFWENFQTLFRLYRGQLDDGQLAPEAPGMRAKLAGNMSQILTTLQAAYTDTPSVASKKHAWEVFRVQIRAIGNAMELWRQSIGDCQHLDLDRLLPRASSELETLDRRLTRIGQLWQARADGQSGDEPDDRELLESLQLEVSRDLIAGLAHRDRAALLSFVQQLNLLDQTSLHLLRTMRVLAGVAPARDVASRTLPPDLYRPPRWDPIRFLNGLLPAVCFTVAFFFWIYFNPPTGPSVPNMAATFGLLVVMTPMNVLMLLPVLMIAMWGAVAPIYFFVMPRLGTGTELLVFMFGFVFAVGNLLVGRLAPLRTATLALFVMMTGISNQQQYSFMGLLNATQMMLLAIVIIAIVQTLFGPSGPEQVLLGSVRRFFCGCARVAGGYSLKPSSDQVQGRLLRKRYFASLVLPALGAVQKVQKRLDYQRHPDNSPEEVQQLIDGMQNITDRLLALEIAVRQVVRCGSQLPNSFLAVTSQIRERLQQVFRQWASLERGDEAENSQGSLSPLFRDLEQQLDALEAIEDQDSINDQTLTDVYTILGNVRGLIEAMANTQDVINQINWQEWATPRF